EGQRHVALIYSPPVGPPRQVGLNWHFSLADERWDGTLLWNEAADLVSVNGAVVAAFLDDLRRSCPRVPYGFRTAGCRFSWDAQTHMVTFNARDPGTGLTCATFVKLVFDALSMPLVEITTWPWNRPEDEAWRERIIDRMTPRTGVPIAHQEALKEQIP